MRKLIALCLALAAMTLFGALGAGSASAAAGEFDFACNQDTPCTFHGVQVTKGVWRINAGSISCTTTTFIGGSSAAQGGTTVFTESGAADWAIHTLKVTTIHTGCTFNGLAATVTTMGCFDTITATSPTTGVLTMDCEAGKSISISVPGAGCTITVGAQTPVNNAVDFAAGEAEGKRDVLVTNTVGTEIPVKGAKSGFKYTSSGGACGESGENGSIRGSLTMKAYKTEKIEAANQVSATIVETLASGKVK